jgi:multiple sugar transport system permease protein
MATVYAAQRGWLRTKQDRRRLITGLLFASPWIVGFLGFTLLPTISSFYYSLTEFSLIKPPVWLGLANYRQLLLADPDFRHSLANTLFMTGFGVPLQLLWGFCTALLLNLPVRGQPLFRTFYLLPSVMPVVASALLWVWILNPQIGPVNYVLEALHLPSPNWFGDPRWTKPSLILMTLWAIGSTTVIYLAGLQGIPQELYEAASIDGAGTVRRLWHITVPLVSPITLFNLITGLIWSLQIFTEAFIIGDGASGGAQGSLLFYAVYLYSNAFSYLKMGYASAMAWILFLITLTTSLVLLRVSRRWTHYV